MLKVFDYGVTKGLLLLTQSASIIAMVTSPSNTTKGGVKMSDKQSQMWAEQTASLTSPSEMSRQTKGLMF